MLRLATSLATLDTLYLGNGLLEPAFDPAKTSYIAWLPEGTMEVPDVYYMTTDPYATVKVDKATEIGNYTYIRITATDNKKRRTYGIKFRIDESDGIKDFLQHSLIVYPNPFSTSATLELNQNSGIERIEMLNILGETVRVIEQVNPGGQVIIQRGNLPAWVYFLRVHAEKTYVIKVLVE